MPKNNRRLLRRQYRKKALAKRSKIVELRTFYPKVGHYRYIKHYDPESGKVYYTPDKRYICYQKNSKGEQYLKNLSARRIRRLPLSEVYGKGNIYRRYFDYWWAID